MKIKFSGQIFER